MFQQNSSLLFNLSSSFISFFCHLSIERYLYFVHFPFLPLCHNDSIYKTFCFSYQGSKWMDEREREWMSVKRDVRVLNMCECEFVCLWVECVRGRRAFCFCWFLVKQFIWMSKGEEWDGDEEREREGSELGIEGEENMREGKRERECHLTSGLLVGEKRLSKDCLLCVCFPASSCFAGKKNPFMSFHSFFESNFLSCSFSLPFHSCSFSSSDPFIVLPLVIILSYVQKRSVETESWDLRRKK